MIKAPLPQNEEERLKSLYSYKILDTLPEEEYDAIAKIASGICDSPIALITLIDKQRQWFKTNHGLGFTETPRELSFCSHSILTPDELFIVNDSTKDERFYNNPMVTDDPNIIFYAGVPLNTSDGFPLGTLCVLDNQPKELSETQQTSLKLLSKQVVKLLELRKVNAEVQELNNKTYISSTGLKANINDLNSQVDTLKKDYESLFKDSRAIEKIQLISDKITDTNKLIDELLEFTDFRYFNK